MVFFIKINSHFFTNYEYKILRFILFCTHDDDEDSTLISDEELKEVVQIDIYMIIYIGGKDNKKLHCQDNFH